MTSCLIGYTGFVGSTLLRFRNYVLKINRTNLDTLAGKEFEIIVCAGLPAEKWKANIEPDNDLRNLMTLVQALEKVYADTFVLISTVDVYGNPFGCDEDTEPTEAHPYGKHRLLLENFVRQRFENHIILRLPALFGHGLKKNILFDLLHNNQVEKINPDSIFQWYKIERLADDIDLLINHEFRGIINLCPEPLSTHEIVDNFFEYIEFTKTSTSSIIYDVRTNFARQFGRRGPYIDSKESVMQQIQDYLSLFNR